MAAAACLSACLHLDVFKSRFIDICTYTYLPQKCLVKYFPRFSFVESYVGNAATILLFPPQKHVWPKSKMCRSSKDMYFKLLQVFVFSPQNIQKNVFSREDEEEGEEQAD